MNDRKPRSTVTDGKRRGLEAAVLALLVAPALWQLFCFCRVAVGRAGYPMDIDWMEGGSLYQAYRLLHDQPIYGPPAGGFAPFPYPPFHTLVLSAIGRITTLDYAAGRGLSSLCFLGSLAIAGFAASEPGTARRRRLTFGMLAVGLVASSYPYVETRFDLVRTDSLGIVLPLAAAALVVRTPFTRSYIAFAALVSVAAVFTRQTNIFFVGWLLVFAVFRNPRSGLLLAVGTGALSVVCLAWALVATHGWFWTWIFTNLGAQPVRWERLTSLDVLRAAPAAPVASLLALVVVRRATISSGAVAWIGMLGSALAASLLPFAKVAGTAADLTPIAVLGPAVALRLASALFETRTSGARRGFAYGAVAVLGAVVLVLRAYTPSAFLPSAGRRAEADALNARVRSLDGGVVIPNHPFIAIRNGHDNEQFHDEGYQDALIAGMPGLDLPAFLRRIDARWLILSGSESAPTRGWICQVYDPSRSLVGMPDTMVGYHSRPADLLRRRRELGKKNVRVLFAFDGDEGQWELDGAAFAHAALGPPGHRYLTSAASPEGDLATGRAISPPFVVDRTHIGFLIGGGASSRLSVALRVDGHDVKQATGVQSDVLFERDWDLRRYAGREARLVLTDLEPAEFGRLLVARVYLFDAVGPRDGDPLPNALLGPVGPARPLRH